MTVEVTFSRLLFSLTVFVVGGLSVAAVSVSAAPASKENGAAPPLVIEQLEQKGELLAVPQPGEKARRGKSKKDGANPEKQLIDRPRSECPGEGAGLPCCLPLCNQAASPRTPTELISALEKPQ